MRKLFNKKVKGKELHDLILDFGEKENFVKSLYATKGEYPHSVYGKFKMQGLNGKNRFKLDIIQIDRSPYGTLRTKTPSLEKIIPFEEINKYPQLRKYLLNEPDFSKSIIFGNLKKSLAVFSVVSILASAFFISNNITGNAILTANSNSSGIIGAGLFVLGLVSWVFARNI